MFSDPLWTDDLFWPYLAGLIDARGRIRLPPEKSTVYLSLWSKDRMLLDAIRDRVNAGSIEERLTTPPRYIWRIHQQHDVERIIGWLVPFLSTTVARDAAYEAVDRFAVRRATRERIKRRNIETLIAWEQHELTGESQADIAARLNTTPAIVARVLHQYRQKHNITIRSPRGRRATSA